MTARRTLLRAAMGAAAGASSLLAARRGGAVPLLVAPRLAEAEVVRSVVGLRPYRQGGVRIERQKVRDKVLVHNYGHGGAGVTLSWGSAVEALDLLAKDPPSGRTVAVVGAGVVGLSTARVAQERGYDVRIYAREFSPYTTSDVAGAEFSPDLVDRGGSELERARFGRMLVASWRRFVAIAGADRGVFR